MQSHSPCESLIDFFFQFYSKFNRRTVKGKATLQPNFSNIQQKEDALKNL